MSNYGSISDSVLITVKEAIGIDRNNTDFDQDLIIAINTVLFILYQEGLADKSYKVKDHSKTWSDILLNGETPEAISSIIQWTALRVKMLFDPPTSSVLGEAVKGGIDELEWRNFITNNYVGEIGLPDDEKTAWFFEVFDSSEEQDPAIIRETEFLLSDDPDTPGLEFLVGKHRGY